MLDVYTSTSILQELDGVAHTLLVIAPALCKITPLLTPHFTLALHLNQSGKTKNVCIYFESNIVFSLMSLQYILKTVYVTSITSNYPQETSS